MTDTVLPGETDIQLGIAQKHALALADRALAQVPAYGGHVGTGVKLEGWDDFVLLPTTSKKGYLQQHPVSDLCWGGNLAQPMAFCSTSGSTGEPFYFPRGELLAEQHADTLQDFLERSVRGATPTLAIVGFGMGVWIGGTLTVRALEIVQRRTGYPLSILPAGVSRSEILSALERLSPQFDQTIIFGYPPFVREVLVDAREAGLDLPSYNIRLSFAAESFSDVFRDFVCDIAGIPNPLVDTLNVFGSADLGAMAAETPTSIMLRGAALQSPELFAGLFGEVNGTPTLAQFEPAHILFEEIDGQLAITGDSSLPLIRYLIGDRGGVLTYNDVQSRLSLQGLDLETMCRANGIPLDNRPFVYVYERVDLSVNLYGLIVYPEYVKHGLEPEQQRGSITGKFAMAVKCTDEQVPYLMVHVESRAAGAVVDPESLAQALTEALRSRSSEFRELTSQLSGRALIKVQAWPAGSAPYFTPGGKQAWVVPTQKVSDQA